MSSVPFEIVLVHYQCSPCLRGDKSAKTSSPRRHGEPRGVKLGHYPLMTTPLLRLLRE
jgi:hypothetical protein